MSKDKRQESRAKLEDSLPIKGLRRYFSVVKNEKPAKFVISQKISAEFKPADSTEHLWTKHHEVVKQFRETEAEIDTGKLKIDTLPSLPRSLLDLKIELARRILLECHLCAHACRIDRSKGNTGYCGCGRDIVVSSMFAHMGEEPELVPSGTIFTMGCTMRCKHCQNWAISQWEETGKTMNTKHLAHAIETLRADGCRNANLVGGEPTPWLEQWLAVFREVRTNIPIVWNSNSYYSQETADLLAGFADVYLLDFKYGPYHCAQRISDAPDYWRICTGNHLQTKCGEIITRVLVLPEHIDCCVKPILEWIAENLGTETRVNIMFQYRPEWRADELAELQRTLNAEEIEEALNIAKDVGLTNLA